MEPAVTCVGSIGGLTGNSQLQRLQGVDLSGPTKGDVLVSSGPTGGRSRWFAGLLPENFSNYFVEKSAPGVLRARDEDRVWRLRRRPAVRGRKRPLEWWRGRPRRRCRAGPGMPGL